MEGIPRRAIRSIVCPAPPVTVAQGDTVTCTGDRAILDRLVIPQTHDPVALLRDLCGQFRCTAGPVRGFFGGLIGYIAYDAVTVLSEGRVDAGREGYLSRFMLCTRGVVYDHAAGSCTLFENVPVPPGSGREDAVREARENLLSLRQEVEAVSPRHGEEITPPGDLSPLSSHPDREEYIGAVGRALEYIREGDIFQVVLSRKVTCPSRADPLSLYGAIRAINPSPYLYCLQFDDEAVIGSSPEMLVRVDGREVQTVPIAGTRPRGRNVAEDEALASDLLSDQKERAEHLMLVDLARNDIGKVAAFGSVKVPVFMEVERFSHVQHIVSTVRGMLREGCDRFDALAACFPAGTVSGAPKERAMQIIAELEKHPRGLYAGAVGYAAFCGPLEFAIAIRTLVAREGRIEFSAGAGIVADSSPEKEFEETEAKARALVEAIRRAGVAK